MTRLSLLLAASPLAASLLLSAGCAQRFDVGMSWSIAGAPAAESCSQFVDPSIQFTIENRETLGSDVVTETATAACVDGAAVIQTGPIARVFVDLVDEDVTYGSGTPVTLNASGNAYAGTDDELRSDITLDRGRLLATFTVVGSHCGGAGVSDFKATVRRNTGPLGQEVLLENSTVPCNADGKAILEFKPVEIGSLYEVVAQTTLGGVEYATSDEDAGAGVVIEAAITDITVDLDVVARP